MSGSRTRPPSRHASEPLVLAARAGWLALGLLLGGCSEPSPPRPGRIILVSMDTVRADHVSGYGAETTPNLAAIAEQGVLFERFYSASSYTLPSTMSMLTGLDPDEHRMTLPNARLSPKVETLAEILGAAGFRTQAFHEGGYVAGRFGFDRGFEAYEELARVAVVGSGLPEILDWVRSARGEPYFLFVHTYAAHYPYGGFERRRREHPERGLPSDAELAELRRRYPPELIRHGRASNDVPDDLRAVCTLYNHLAEDHESRLGCGDNSFPDRYPGRPGFEPDIAAVMASYDERIRMIDDALGELKSLLIDLGEWQDTLLIVTSDHGEAFFEHRMQRHDFVPFEEVVRVPLVISYPRLLGSREGRRVSDLAWHLDLMPTILGLAGLEPLPDRAGLDLTKVLVGEERLPSDRAVFPAVLRNAHKPQEPLRRLAIRGDLKLIEGHRRYGDSRGLLFDLGSDPGELDNLRRDRAERFDSLVRLARRYAEGLEPRQPLNQRTGQPLSAAEGDDATPLSPEEEEKLRALGYVN